MGKTNGQIKRAAQFKAAFAGKTFTIVGRVRLSKNAPKFRSWPNNSRGYEGYLITDVSTGRTTMVGRTAVEAAIRHAAITNPMALDMSVQDLNFPG